MAKRGIFIGTLATIVLAGLAPASRADDGAPAVHERDTDAPSSDAADGGGKCMPAERCCQVCDRGQACGNACISRKKSCHKGRGCACNESELCAP